MGGPLSAFLFTLPLPQHPGRRWSQAREVDRDLGPRPWPWAAPACCPPLPVGMGLGPEPRPDLTFGDWKVGSPDALLCSGHIHWSCGSQASVEYQVVLLSFSLFQCLTGKCKAYPQIEQCTELPSTIPSFGSSELVTKLVSSTPSTHFPNTTESLFFFFF